MKYKSAKDKKNHLVFLLWGMIFTKCFSLEYLVRKYEVPIESIYYVWGLSLVMATVATTVYGRIERTAFANLLKTPYSLIKLIAFIIAGSFIFWTLIDPNAHVQMSLFIAALSIGLGQLLKPKGQTYRIAWPKTLLWGLSGLISLNVDSTTGYLFFALTVLLTSVLPPAVELFTKSEK